MNKNILFYVALSFSLLHANNEYQEAIVQHLSAFHDGYVNENRITYSIDEEITFRYSQALVKQIKTKVKTKLYQQKSDLEFLRELKVMYDNMLLKKLNNNHSKYNCYFQGLRNHLYESYNVIDNELTSMPMHVKSHNFTMAS